jgi:hypothetical protein
MGITPIFFFSSLGISVIAFLVYSFCYCYLRRSKFKKGDPVKFHGWNTYASGFDDMEGFILETTFKNYTLMIPKLRGYSQPYIRKYSKEEGNKLFKEREYVVYDPANQCNRTFKYTR